MKSFHQIIKEATAEQDKQYRAEAEKFYRKLVDLVEDEEKIYQNAGSVTTGKLKGGIRFSGALLDPEYKNLGIIFSPPRKEFMAAFGPPKNKPEINFLVLPYLQQEYSLDGLLEELVHKREHVIHEIIHYLDAMRWKGGAKDFARFSHSRHAGEATPEQYFNNPMEFNAFYQQAVDQYSNQLKKAIQQKSHKIDILIPKDASSFIKMIKKYFFRQDFVDYLNPTFSRKLDKRLADLYNYVKGEVQK